uniref:Uncharacterized protein n=1 Tax=Anguilla anguilla TaxID=7936 RepID=A0A0E9SBM3_ANGAN
MGLCCGLFTVQVFSEEQYTSLL